MPSGFVVINFYVFKNGLSHGFPVHDWLVLNRLNLQWMEEALCTGIVPAAGFAAHTFGKLMFFNQISIGMWTILATAVAVNNYIFREPTAEQCHSQCITSQLSRHTIIHWPANHSSRVQINNHRQIQPAFACHQIRDITDPFLVRASGIEVLLQ